MSAIVTDCAPAYVPGAGVKVGIAVADGGGGGGGAGAWATGSCATCKVWPAPHQSEVWSPIPNAHGMIESVAGTASGAAAGYAFPFTCPSMTVQVENPAASR